MARTTVSATPGGSPDARPPLGAPAPPPGVAAAPRPPRPTVLLRPRVRPRPWRDALAELGFPPDHPYVRRFWTAVIGRGAVADLLRLTVAAQRDRSLLRPVHLPLLLHEGLVRRAGDDLWVRTTIPPLGVRQVRRLAPRLRREHAEYRMAVPAGSSSR